MAVINKTSAIKSSTKHLLGIQNLSIQEAKRILDSGKRTQEQINSNPIGALLVVGLEQTYPCKNNN